MTVGLARLTVQLGALRMATGSSDPQAAKCRIFSKSDWLQETMRTVGIVPGIVIKNYRIVGIIVEINM